MCLTIDIRWGLKPLKRLRNCADRLAAGAMGDDEDGVGLVEEAPTREMLREPKKDYTKTLWAVRKLAKDLEVHRQDIWA